MKTTAPLVFGFLVGLVMFLQYFFPTPSMQRAYNVVLDWKQVVIGMTLILGVWSLVNHSGGAFGPVLVGLMAQFAGFPATFAASGALVVLSALLMLAYGPDTRRKHAPPATATA